MKQPQVFLLLVIFAFLLSWGCGTLRTEFYRGETGYLYTQGKGAYESEDYDKACKYFELVVELDPGYAHAFVGLGNVALIKGEFKEAEGYYRKAIELDPELKEKLMPLVLVSMEKRKFKQLRSCGVDLKDVFEALSSGRDRDVDRMLSEDVPVDLLARDTRSLGLKERARLKEMIVDRARVGIGSPRSRLFYGYFLYYSDGHDWLTAKVLEETATGLSGEDRQAAYIKVAELYERMGRESRAVTAYLKAVDAGMPMSEVAPMLAKIYGVPVKEITGAPQDPDQVAGYEAPEPSVQTTGFPSGTIKAMKPEKNISHQGVTIQKSSGTQGPNFMGMGKEAE